jgi:hypothetical protein
MTVETLIKVLQKEVKKTDRANAEIEIWCGDQEYEIESMGGFSLSPDITINIKPIESPMIKPAVFKKEYKEMVKDTIKKIKKGERNQ